jgi:cytochrome c556
MKRITKTLCFGFSLAIIATAAACDRPERMEVVEDPPRASTSGNEGGEWLRGGVDTRFALVAKHLRGFDVAMVEVGYRYTELYWAGRDRNWEYAAYQLGKIETAVANGIERRPRRAASAQMFAGPVKQVRAAIDERDGSALDSALDSLTATCNACHRAENVSFVTVAPPVVRLSPVRAGGSRDGQQEGAIQ